MSEPWNEGYFTDTAYTHGYYREVSPSFQRFCLLLQGVKTPNPGDKFCELALGQGVSFAIHAATHQGTFIGNDFNPAQIAAASELLKPAGSASASIHDDSFKEFLARPGIGPFDSISVHGIWTWVTKENRDQIVEFARRYLRPGGAFYISYNCYPGWAPAAPLRYLFSLWDRFEGGRRIEPLKRVDGALEFAQTLLDANPNYLRLVPSLQDRLKRISEQNKQYIAHEYFNQEWNCLYFLDTVDELAKAKIEFAGTASPLELLDDVISMRPETAEFLKTVKNPLMKEQVRDYLVNRQFRKDIFVKGVNRLNVLEQMALLEDQRIVLTQSPKSIELKIATAVGELQLKEELYQAVIDYLASESFRPKTILELKHALKEPTLKRLMQAVIVIVGMSYAMPCQSEDVIQSVCERTSKLNRYLCQRAVTDPTIQFLASAVTGSGHHVTNTEQIFLHCLYQGQQSAQDWIKFALNSRKSSANRFLSVDAEDHVSQEKWMSNIQKQAEKFVTERLPVFQALKIV